MKRTIWIILFMLVGVVYADQIPSLKTWVASESYKATDMNANFAKIRSIVNGLLREDNFPSGFTIPASWVAHLTWPSHGSSHAAAGSDPLATDSTYLVGNIAATNATFTNVTAGQVDTTGLSVTNATATNLTATNLTTTSITTSSFVPTTTATFPAGISITGGFPDGSYNGLDARGLIMRSWQLVTSLVVCSDFQATASFLVSSTATFTGDVGFTGQSDFAYADIASLSANNAAFYSANIATLSASQVQVSSLTTESRLTVGGNLYMSGGGNLLMEGGYMDMAGGIITNVATPSAAVQAANKGYVDSLAASVNIECSNYVATVPSITYSPASPLTVLSHGSTSEECIATYSYTNSSSVASKTVVVEVPFSVKHTVGSGTDSVVFMYLSASGTYAFDTKTSIGINNCLAVTISENRFDTVTYSRDVDNGTLKGVCIVPPSGTAVFVLRARATQTYLYTGSSGLIVISVPTAGFNVMSW